MDVYAVENLAAWPALATQRHHHDMVAMVDQLTRHLIHHSFDSTPDVGWVIVGGEHDSH